MKNAPSLTRPMSADRRLVALAMVATALPLGAGAQTRSARDTATAYGARLNARGEPANLNPNRINDRVSSRLDTRLSLRVERYRPDSTDDPAAAFKVRATDNARVGTETTLSPLATTSPVSSAASQAHEAPSRTSAAQAADELQPR